MEKIQRAGGVMVVDRTGMTWTGCWRKCGGNVIEITIKLDTEAVSKAVSEAWQQAFSFSPTGYSQRDKGGAGWQEVARQVRDFIATMDLTAEIQAAARARLANVVDEVVTTALREQVKQRAKEMKKDGTLFMPLEGR